MTLASPTTTAEPVVVSTEYSLRFLTAREIQIIDEDPVLVRADFWEGDR